MRARAIVVGPPTSEGNASMGQRHKQGLLQQFIPRPAVPFAPSVKREQVQDRFEPDCDSPYMLRLADVVPSRWLKSRINCGINFGIKYLI